jgi:hypothetical protein
MKRQKIVKFKPNEKTTQIESPTKCKAKSIHNKQNGHQTKFISKLIVDLALQPFVM